MAALCREKERARQAGERAEPQQQPPPPPERKGGCGGSADPAAFWLLGGARGGRLPSASAGAPRCSASTMSAAGGGGGGAGTPKALPSSGPKSLRDMPHPLAASSSEEAGAELTPSPDFQLPRSIADKVAFRRRSSGARPRGGEGRTPGGWRAAGES